MHHFWIIGHLTSFKVFSTGLLTTLNWGNYSYRISWLYFCTYWAVIPMAMLTDPIQAFIWTTSRLLIKLLKVCTISWRTIFKITKRLMCLPQTMEWVIKVSYTLLITNKLVAHIYVVFTARFYISSWFLARVLNVGGNLPVMLFWESGTPWSPPRNCKTVEFKTFTFKSDYLEFRTFGQ